MGPMDNSDLRSKQEVEVAANLESVVGGNDHQKILPAEEESANEGVNQDLLVNGQLVVREKLQSAEKERHQENNYQEILPAGEDSVIANNNQEIIQTEEETVIENNNSKTLPAEERSVFENAQQILPSKVKNVYQDTFTVDGNYLHVYWNHDFVQAEEDIHINEEIVDRNVTIQDNVQIEIRVRGQRFHGHRNRHVCQLNGSVQDGHQLNGSVQAGQQLSGSTQDDRQLGGSVQDGCQLNGSAQDGRQLNRSTEDGHQLNGSVQVGQQLSGSVPDGHQLNGSVQNGREAHSLNQDRRHRARINRVRRRRNMPASESPDGSTFNEQNRPRHWPNQDIRPRRWPICGHSRRSWPSREVRRNRRSDRDGHAMELINLLIRPNQGMGFRNRSIQTNRHLFLIQDSRRRRWSLQIGRHRYLLIQRTRSPSTSNN